MSEEHNITDSYQRRVSYLRFSVTDRCNLHCVYCRSDGPEEFIPHEAPHPRAEAGQDQRRQSFH